MSHLGRDLGSRHAPVVGVQPFAESGGLPGGITFVNGLLSGTPALGTAGTYNLTITASNGVDTNATQPFTLTINEPIAIQSVQFNDGSI